MTEQSKINRKTADATSLFERADQAFGLERPTPGFDPKALPPRKAKMPDHGKVSLSEPTLDRATPGQVRGAPATGLGESAETRVELSGEFIRIDRDRLRAEGLIVPEDPVSALLEEMRIIKRGVIADARRGGRPRDRRILICSPHQGDGKTYSALNLAIALAAEREIEVLLVDADTIRPSITRRLGIEDGPGLMDALADPTIQPETLALRTDVEGLFVMSAGSTGAGDSEYLASARTDALLDRLTRNASNRFVIFDTPPALAASPAAELAGHVGQAIVVARAYETSRAALEDAQELLSACPNVKLLLNAARFSPSGRRFGEYEEHYS